jgi:hypothetical protein
VTLSAAAMIGRGMSELFGVCIHSSGEKKELSTSVGGTAPESSSMYSSAWQYLLEAAYLYFLLPSWSLALSQA